MAKIDLGKGEQEFRCTYYTLTAYEMEFHSDPYECVTGDLIKDVFGKVEVKEDSFGAQYDDDGNIVSFVIDYTIDNWNVEKRALWAMLKTADEIDRVHGVKRDPFPSFREWDRSLMECDVNIHDIARAVMDELYRGLFRSGAADSE